jgi:DUF2075 family protein
MRVAFAGTLDEARAHVVSGSFPDRLTEGFRSAFRRDPGKDEVNTWRSTLPVVLEVAASAVPGDCGLLIEYGLPFNDQRIDVLLIGGRKGTPAAHVLELKNWEASRASARLEHFVEVGGGITPHPSYQALNYAGKLANFHSFGSTLEVSQSAVIIDGAPDRHGTLSGPRFARFLSEAPLFISPDLTGLEALLRDKLPEAPSKEWIENIVTGQYTQSARLLDTLRGRQAALIKRASEVLASSGWGLSKDQLQVCDEILAAIEQRERAVFCVSGGPGSGKSLLAMHLFLGAIGLGRKSILAVRNNRLNVALAAILDRELIGARGAIKYFSTTGNAGVEDGSSEVADFLVCDEGQRLALRSNNVFLRAPIVVVLYDEKQILNEAERGTKEAFSAMCKQIAIEPRFRTLPAPHRCRGGYAYLQWIDMLLEQPDHIRDLPRDWLREYSFEIATSPEDLLARLRFRPGRTGLVASFTRSSGKTDPQNPRDLGRIRVPETQPPIRWLMQPREDYVPFYLEGRSNQLNTCASIYGAQGFELDHTGLFWGTDLVIRNGGWALGDPDDCYDRAPGARALSTVMRNDRELALKLLRNRYRILLTRGIFGTAVYCEDGETSKFLQNLLL